MPAEPIMSEIYKTRAMSCCPVSILMFAVGNFRTIDHRARLRHLAELRKKLDDLRPIDPEYGLHAKKAEVLSISQNAANVPIAYVAMTSSRLATR